MSSKVPEAKYAHFWKEITVESSRGFAVWHSVIPLALIISKGAF